MGSFAAILRDARPSAGPYFLPSKVQIKFRTMMRKYFCLLILYVIILNKQQGLCRLPLYMNSQGTVVHKIWRIFSGYYSQKKKGGYSNEYRHHICLTSSFIYFFIKTSSFIGILLTKSTANNGLIVLFHSKFKIHISMNYTELNFSNS